MRLLFLILALVLLICSSTSCLIEKCLLSFAIGSLILTFGPGVLSHLLALDVFGNLRYTALQEVIHQLGVLICHGSCIVLFLAPLVLPLALGLVCWTMVLGLKDVAGRHHVERAGGLLVLMCWLVFDSLVRAEDLSLLALTRLAVAVELAQIMFVLLNFFLFDVELTQLGRVEALSVLRMRARKLAFCVVPARLLDLSQFDLILILCHHAVALSVEVVAAAFKPSLIGG